MLETSSGLPPGPPVGGASPEPRRAAPALDPREVGSAGAGSGGCSYSVADPLALGLRGEGRLRGRRGGGAAARPPLPPPSPELSARRGAERRPRPGDEKAAAGGRRLACDGTFRLGLSAPAGGEAAGLGHGGGWRSHQPAARVRPARRPPRQRCGAEAGDDRRVAGCAAASATPAPRSRAAKPQDREAEPRPSAPAAIRSRSSGSRAATRVRRAPSLGPSAAGLPGRSSPARGRRSAFRIVLIRRLRHGLRGRSERLAHPLRMRRGARPGAGPAASPGGGWRTRPARAARRASTAARRARPLPISSSAAPACCVGSTDAGGTQADRRAPRMISRAARPTRSGPICFLWARSGQQRAVR